MSRLEISPDDWIVVPDWNKFQHYGDRNPPWIKVYTKLLHDPKFLQLSSSARGVLMTIWLLYAAEHGLVRVSFLTRFGRKLAGYYQLESLNHAGFIQFSASKPLAPSTEKEKEKESPSPLVENLNHAAFEFAASYEGNASEEFGEGLNTLERDFEHQLTELQRMKLWELAFGSKQ